MQNPGKYGEFLVLAQLLKMDIEAYQAVKINQKDYDITVVRSVTDVIRIQVKTTDAQNNSTNNVISNVDKNYDFLVIVIVESSAERMFILSKREVLSEKTSANKIYTTEQASGKTSVRSNLIQYENQWQNI